MDRRGGGTYGSHSLARRPLFITLMLAVLAVGCATAVDGGGQPLSNYTGTFRSHEKFIAGHQGQLALKVQSQHLFGVLYGRNFRTCIVARAFGKGLVLYPGLPSDYIRQRIDSGYGELDLTATGLVLRQPEQTAGAHFFPWGKTPQSIGFERIAAHASGEDMSMVDPKPRQRYSCLPGLGLRLLLAFVRQH